MVSTQKWTSIFADIQYAILPNRDILPSMTGRIHLSALEDLDLDHALWFLAFWSFISLNTCTGVFKCWSCALKGFLSAGPWKYIASRLCLLVLNWASQIGQPSNSQPVWCAPNLIPGQWIRGNSVLFDFTNRLLSRSCESVICNVTWPDC